MKSNHQKPYPQFGFKNGLSQKNAPSNEGRVIVIAQGYILAVNPIIGLIVQQFGKRG
jgi:hypothetical protein